MNDYTKSTDKATRSAPIQKERQKKVIDGAERQQKSVAQRVLGMFISDDIDDVKSYLVHDIVIPWAKEAFFSAVDGLIHGRGRSSPTDMASRISYQSSSYYNNYNRTNRREPTRTGATSECDYGDVIVRNRGEAEALLAALDDIMDRYGVVSVLDLYDMAGLPTKQSYNRYGWENIRSARIVQLRDGRHVLKMPRMVPLDTPWD